MTLRNILSLVTTMGKQPYSRLRFRHYLMSFVAVIIGLVFALFPHLTYAKNKKPQLTVVILISDLVGDETEEAIKLKKIKPRLEGRLKYKLCEYLNITVKIESKKDNITGQENKKAEIYGLDDLFPIAKSWIKKESKSNYYILGILDGFGGEFDLEWQLIEVGSARNDELNWRRHYISYKLINPNSTGLIEVATAISNEIKDMIPVIKKRLGNEKVKISCFKVDGNVKNMNIPPEVRFQELISVLPDAIADALKDIGFQEGGYEVEPTLLSEVNTKCTKQENIDEYLLKTLEVTDYLIWGRIGRAGQDKVGFTLFVYTRKGKDYIQLCQSEHEELKSEMISKVLAQKIMTRWYENVTKK